MFENKNKNSDNKNLSEKFRILQAGENKPLSLFPIDK